MKIVSRLSVAIWMVVCSPILANPVDLSGPGGLLGNATLHGGATVQLDYQDVDAGDGVKLPLRFIFDSQNWTESPYGWTGWTATLLEAKCTQLSPVTFEAKLVCGKSMYFQPQVGTSSGSTVGDGGTGTGGTGTGGTGTGGTGSGDLIGTSAGATPIPEWWQDQTGAWTGHYTKAGSIVTFDITRWDGWSLHYVNGRLITLTADNGKVINWNYSGSSNRLSTITISGQSQPILTVNYASSGIPTSIIVNGDTYTLNIELGLLKKIEQPDSTADSFAYSSNYSLYNLQSTGDPAGSDSATSTMTRTDRYSVANTLTWQSTNGYIVSDGIWNYIINQPGGWVTRSFGAGVGSSGGSGSGGTSGSSGTGGASVGDTMALPWINHSGLALDYEVPKITRVRAATGEKESIEYQGTDNPVSVYTGFDGTQYRKYEIKTTGPLFGKTETTEIKYPGQDWATVKSYAYDATTGRVARVTDANNLDTVYTYTNISGASQYAPPATKLVTDPSGRTKTSSYDVRGNLVAYVDGAGVNRSYGYDSRDRLAEIKNNAGVVVAQFGYNNNDKLTSIKDADSNETVLEYLDRYG